MKLILNDNGKIFSVYLYDKYIMLISIHVFIKNIYNTLFDSGFKYVIKRFEKNWKCNKKGELTSKIIFKEAGIANIDRD